MHYQEHFYYCSPEYIDAIDERVRREVLGAVSRLRKRKMQGT